MVQARQTEAVKARRRICSIR